MNSKQVLKSDTASINCIIVLKRLNLTRLPDLLLWNTPETLKAAILHSHLHQWNECHLLLWLKIREHQSKIDWPIIQAVYSCRLAQGNRNMFVMNLQYGTICHRALADASEIHQYKNVSRLSSLNLWWMNSFRLWWVHKMSGQWTSVNSLWQYF